MPATIVLGALEVELVRKDIRNVHLSVLPPDGRVRLSAPPGRSEESLRLFLISKLGWIRKQRKRLAAQERETRRDYLDRESHRLWGQRCLLVLREREAAPAVELSGRRLILTARHGSSKERLEEILDAWYRRQLREAAASLLAAWQPRLGVEATGIFVQHMKTRWGSCNPLRGHIRLNTELAKKPRDCLEYILVHELLHFLEPSHGARFVALTDRHLPQWRERRAMLNRLPIRHEDWEY